MERITSLVLVMLLTIGMFVSPVSSEPTLVEKISPDAAQAYYEVLNEIVGNYGVTSLNDNNMPEGQGLWYSDLIDFNNDGKPELLCLYSRSGNYVPITTTVCEVWSFEGKAVLKHTNKKMDDIYTGGEVEDRGSNTEFFPFISAGGNSGAIGLAWKDSRPYLHYYNWNSDSINSWQDDYYYGLDDNNALVSKRLNLYDIYELDYETGELIRHYNTYEIDGGDVSESEYKKDIATFKNVKHIGADSPHLFDDTPLLKSSNPDLFSTLKQKVLSTYALDGWEKVYAEKLTGSDYMIPDSYLVLCDMNFDGIPELFEGVSYRIMQTIDGAFTTDGNVIKPISLSGDFSGGFVEDNSDVIGIFYFMNMKLYQNRQTGEKRFIGETGWSGAGGVETTVVLESHMEDSVLDVKEICSYSSSGFLEEDEKTYTFKGNPISKNEYDSLRTGYFDQWELVDYDIVSTYGNALADAANPFDSFDYMKLADFFYEYKWMASLTDDYDEFTSDDINRVIAELNRSKSDNRYIEGHEIIKISKLSRNVVFVKYSLIQPGIENRYYYAALEEHYSNGRKGFEVISDSFNNSSFSLKGLTKYKKVESLPANIAIDYSVVSGFKNAQDYVTNLDQLLSEMEEVPNNNAVNEVVKYIEYAIAKSNVTRVKAKNNSVIVSEKIFTKAYDNTIKTKGQFDGLLEKHSLAPNKPLKVVVTLAAGKLTIDKPARIEFSTDIIDGIKDADGIQIIIDDKYHSVYVDKNDLIGLLNGSGIATVEIQKQDEDSYKILFLDSDNNALEQIPYPMMFSLPADSEYSVIMANYKGGSDSWGGQYDVNTQTIQFETSYSGEYSVLENVIEIDDIESLTEEQKKAIKFMVSKGYFELDGNNFNPYFELTRYDFTSALVKIFFALDKEAQATFTDVPAGNKYYHYVSSAQDKDIAKGFEDNTFRGDTNTTKEEVIAFSGRTLADKKGYFYPEAQDSYLQFADAADISDWAKPDIALSVSASLMEGGGLLNPKSNISRMEGAEILYNLFMLLYEVSPASTLAVSSESDPMPIILGVGGVVLLAGGAGAFVYTRKRKKVTS